MGQVLKKYSQSGLKSGFTLAELAIALAVVAVISAMLIPKILQTQQDERIKAIGKDTFARLGAAYQDYLEEHSPATTMTSADLLPYLENTGQYTGMMDSRPTGGSVDCSSANCYQLTNGAIVDLRNATFNSSASTNALRVYMDPEPGWSGNASPNEQGAWIWIYWDGSVSSRNKGRTNTCDSSGCFNPNSTSDPSWLTW